jgi:hypothetical protein
MRRLIRSTVFVVALATTLMMPALALACPDCPTARVVRATVFAGPFVPQLVLLSIPMVALGVIAAFLHRIGLAERTTPALDREPER